MIKSGTHIDKMLKGIAKKKRQKPEECLAAILMKEWRGVFGKDYLG